MVKRSQPLDVQKNAAPLSVWNAIVLCFQVMSILGALALSFRAGALFEQMRPSRHRREQLHTVNYNKESRDCPTKGNFQCFLEDSKGSWEYLTHLAELHNITEAQYHDLAARKLAEKRQVKSKSRDHVQPVKKANEAPLPPPSGHGWSAAQQKQLEGALRKFPSSLEKNERWTKIANAVDGKSKRECVARFKELRAGLSQK